MFASETIETARLIIRPFRLPDLEAIYSIVSDDDVMKFLPDDRMSKDRFKGVLKWLISCYGKNTADNILKLTLAITLKDTQTIIGWCGLGPLEINPADIEIYYGLAKKFWGQGIATEAASAILDCGFNNIGLKKIVAVVSPLNLASRRVIEKLGMIYVKQVAGLPSRFINYENDLYYSLSQAQYLKMKK